MLFDPLKSKVFGSSDVKLEGVLKNPNEFREAVLFESLNNLPNEKKKEFVKSKEAKTMVSEGFLNMETLHRLAHECDHHHGIHTMVCHMAKENGDPLWDELVECRIRERRLINELIAKYGEEAKPAAETAEKEFVESCIPEYFRK